MTRLGQFDHPEAPHVPGGRRGPTAPAPDETGGRLAEAIRWFAERCGVEAGFSDDRMAVPQLGQFTLILDAAFSDSS